MSHLLDIGAAAARLGISKEYLRVLAHRAAIKHTRDQVGGRLLFSGKELDAYARKQRNRKKESFERYLIKISALQTALLREKGDAAEQAREAAKHLKKAAATLQKRVVSRLPASSPPGGLRRSVSRAEQSL